jgi:hypothetical protein
LKTFSYYLSALRAKLTQSDSTEHTHRAALQCLPDPEAFQWVHFWNGFSGFAIVAVVPK